MIPNLWLRLIGLNIVGWLGYAYVASFVGSFPSGPFIDMSLIIFLGLLFYLFVFYFHLPLTFYYGIICVSALIQAAIAICQHLWFDPVSTLLVSVVKVTGEMDFSTPVGTLGNPNFLGAYLAISLPFFFRRRWVWFLPVIGYSLYIADASAACGAAIIGLGFFFLGKWGFIAIVPAIVYVVILGRHSILTLDRYSFWMDAIQKACHSPSSFLFGYGQGTTWQVGNQLHNEYVATFFHYGITGLSCMVAYMVSLFRGNKTLVTALLILAVNMGWNHPLHTVPTAMLAIIVIALIEREKMEGLKNGMDSNNA